MSFDVKICQQKYSVDYDENIYEIKCIETPAQCAYIYFLFNSENELLYIGQTQNIQVRVSSHKKNHPQVQYAKYFHVDKNKINEVEAELILSFYPPLNQTIPQNEKWINIPCFQKLNICLKGKAVKIKKAIKFLRLQSMRGYFLKEDLKKVIPIVCEVKNV